MKNAIRNVFFLSLPLFLMACATSGPKVTPSEYGQNIHAVSSESLSEKGCRKVTEKEVAWQDQMKIANACWSSGKFSRLEAWGQKTVEEHPDSPWGMFYLSVVEYEKQRWSLSAWYLERALRILPENGLLIYQKARILWQQAKESESARWALKAIERDPKMIDAYVFVGQIYARNRQHDKAVAVLERAVEIAPDHIAAQENLRRLKSEGVLVIGQSRKEKSMEAGQ